MSRKHFEKLFARAREVYRSGLEKVLAATEPQRKWLNAKWRVVADKIAKVMNLRGQKVKKPRQHTEFNRERSRRSFYVSISVHTSVILVSLIMSFLSARGCLYETPAGVPGSTGDQLPKGNVQPIRAPKVVRRRQKVRKSPVQVFEMLEEVEQQQEQDTARHFADSVGVPGGVGQGGAAGGSPHGTKVGGKLHFYRVKYRGRNWKANWKGAKPLMKEVLRANVVKEVAGFNNVVPLKKLPKHSGKYLPNLLYMTGTGHIHANNQEIKNMRDYLLAGGMLFADNSGGHFHRHFVRFMRKVLPKRKFKVIEYDHEIYRGQIMPYAMVRGCPIYRAHRGHGPALGIWVGPRISVFYSRGDLGSAWATAGIFKARKRKVERAFRMGVNIVTYSLLYYKYTSPNETQK
ncbi:MAG: DUF4159 domain-containing protein [Planctomycetes bacterium]|nr:DUF4159 domain-containing protein [Planctomycetota bacterium]